MDRFEVTRRKFISLLAGLQCLMCGGSQAAEATGQLRHSAIDDLNLSAQELEDLEKSASPILTAARSLDELNLGNLPVNAIAPDFVFAPGSLSSDKDSKMNDDRESSETLGI